MICRRTDKRTASSRPSPVATNYLNNKTYDINIIIFLMHRTQPLKYYHIRYNRMVIILSTRETYKQTFIKNMYSVIAEYNYRAFSLVIFYVYRTNSTRCNTSRVNRFMCVERKRTSTSEYERVFWSCSRLVKSNTISVLKTRSIKIKRNRHFTQNSSVSAKVYFYSDALRLVQRGLFQNSMRRSCTIRYTR